jgi:hypothetical protein
MIREKIKPGDILYVSYLEFGNGYRKITRMIPPEEVVILENNLKDPYIKTSGGYYSSAILFETPLDAKNYWNKELNHAIDMIKEKSEVIINRYTKKLL